MSKSVAPYVTVGLAIAGAGLFLAHAPGQGPPTVTTAAVQLASVGVPPQ